MAGDVHAGGLLLHLEQLVLVKGWQVGHGRRRGLHLAFRHAEQGNLPDNHALLPAGDAVHGFLEHIQLLGAASGQLVQRPAADQALHALLVQLAAGHPVDKVVQVPVGPRRLPLGHQRLHGLQAQVLHRAQAEADALGPAGVVHGEPGPGAVHVRRQHRDALLATILYVEGDLLGVAQHGIHHRRHELGGEFQLQPRRLHGHQGVGCRVALVEGVAREGRHLVEQPGGDVLGDAVAHAAGHHHVAVFIHLAVDKDLFLMGHHIVLLLGHGTAHQITAAHGIARQVPHNLHDLLLVNHAAVGHIQYGLEPGRQVLDRIRVLLARHVAGNRLHRTRSVQRYRSDDVLKIRGPHLHQKLGHARGFQLEYARGVAVGNHLIDPGLVQWNILAGKILPQPVPGHIDGVHDDVQSPESQEVHLQKAQRLHRAHGKLSGDHVVVGLERAVVHHRLRGDQHARRVGGGVAGHALQLPGHIDQPVNGLVVFIG